MRQRSTCTITTERQVFCEVTHDTKHSTFSVKHGRGGVMATKGIDPLADDVTADKSSV